MTLLSNASIVSRLFSSFIFYWPQSHLQGTRHQERILEETTAETEEDVFGFLGLLFPCLKSLKGIVAAAA